MGRLIIALVVVGAMLPSVALTKTTTTKKNTNNKKITYTVKLGKFATIKF